MSALTGNFLRTNYSHLYNLSETQVFQKPLSVQEKTYLKEKSQALQNTVEQVRTVMNTRWGILDSMNLKNRRVFLDVVIHMPNIVAEYINKYEQSPKPMIPEVIYSRCLTTLSHFIQENIFLISIRGYLMHFLSLKTLDDYLPIPKDLNLDPDYKFLKRFVKSHRHLAFPFYLRGSKTKPFSYHHIIDHMKKGQTLQGLPLPFTYTGSKNPFRGTRFHNQQRQELFYR